MSGDVDVDAATVAEDEPAELAATNAASSPAADRFAAGTHLGRFVVLGRLGMGAMGLVLAAYDPDLDRKVALKVLHPTAWGGNSAPEGRERLLREARAMARLQHPNVLTVHEVGTSGDDVFLATEFAAGGTLRGWLGAARRSWREVLAIFAAAGRGLAAAHRAGLVHRDFKPENVLLTRDDEVRVADFGLVGRGGVDLPGTEEDRLLDSGTSTQTGTLLGTPAYMAPEQHARTRAGPAADQFAFAVALWEGLYGERPFGGKTYWELAASVQGGEVREPPAASEVPAWVRDVLVRALRTRAEDRWPAMDALLAALAADPAARRRRRLRSAAVVGGFVALTAVAAAAVAFREAAAAVPCRDSARRLAGAWDLDRRAAVRVAFVATGRPYAGDTSDRIGERLDRFATAWVGMHREACEATHDRNEQSGETARPAHAEPEPAPLTESITTC